jgi:stearoyl-CoA desaturase (delta-9 desaturase)
MTVSGSLSRTAVSPAAAVSAGSPQELASPGSAQELASPGLFGQLITGVLVIAPLAAVVAVGIRAGGHGVPLLDLWVALAFYAVAGHGATIGFHRYLTHRAFKAKRPLRIALAVAGCLAVEGGPISWVALHRRHHRFSDAEGDPHSPYRFGTTPFAQLKGLIYAHVGWLFTGPSAQPEVYAPDLLADRDIRIVDRLFPFVAISSVLAPFFLGWLITGRLSGALGMLLWAGLVRIAVLHHVTWSVNSICHVLGERPFRTRSEDRARNFWPLAIISMGESWHNLHHADPTCARHGVDRFQLDSSARLIRWFEAAGWATEVRWPQPDRLSARRRSAADGRDPAFAENNRRPEAQPTRTRSGPAPRRGGRLVPSAERTR